jgi:hydrogenase expression/formation protein HypC
MCLAIPGKILSIEDNESLMRTGKVDFGGIIKDISLAYVPEARLGDYVIVHAGIALTILDEKEAQKTIDDLKQIEKLGNLEKD